MFAAETSGLYLPGKPATWWLQQLYRDNPTLQGICLRSARTGDVLRFLLIQATEERGWVSAWLFKAIGVEPELFVAIYNDACRVEEGVEVLPG